MLKRLVRICVALVLMYVGFVGLLYCIQSYLIYFPSKIEAYSSADLDRINAIVFNKNDLEWLYLPAYQAGSDKVLVYFHGNGGMAYDRASKSEIWRENGFEVILAEYPGYGTNDRKPSEDNFYNAARVILDHTFNHFPNADLYLYGESIGSGVATQMATEYDEKALIIEAGFTSLTLAASNHYFYVPVSYLIKDTYDNQQKINSIESNLYVIHGRRDRVIPFEYGQALYHTYSGPKRFYDILNGGHNDLYIHADMQKIINEIK